MLKAPKIVVAPAAVLRKKAEPVSVREIGGRALLELVAKMRASLATRDDGIAIAAPQVGVSKRLFVVSERAVPLFPPGAAELVFVNPIIVKRSLDKKAVEEGCLSVPKIYGRVRRATRAVVKATDEHGREFSVIGRGLLAQIFQHETDHLEGKLFVDSAKETWEFDPEHPNAGKK
ncbi:MAG TPA: peptide deformylase [Candidatus Paceibacterota bacterium]